VEDRILKVTGGALAEGADAALSRLGAEIVESGGKFDASGDLVIGEAESVEIWRLGVETLGSKNEGLERLGILPGGFGNGEWLFKGAWEKEEVKGLHCIFTSLPQKWRITRPDMRFDFRSNADM
jgi:hypothetical protein